MPESAIDATILAMLAPFAAAALAPWAVRAFGHTAGWWLAIIPAAIFIHLSQMLPTIADEGSVFNPQTQTRVSWPAEPVVALAYMDQLVRSDALADSLADDLSSALERAAEQLEGGATDAKLAAELDTLATALPPTKAAGLADTLSGIGARLR